MSVLVRLATEVPGRESARGLVRDELRDQAYEDAKPPALLDLLGRGVRKLVSLVGNATDGLGGGWVASVVLVALLALAAAVVLARVRPRRTARPGGDLFAGSRLLSAAEHRALAQQAAAAGAFHEAIRERLRATVRELEDRGVLEPRPGRTAGEIAREAGQAAPVLSAPLHAAARTFDEVWYGGRPADAAGYQLVTDADETVLGARLVAP